MWTALKELRLRRSNARQLSRFRRLAVEALEPRRLLAALVWNPTNNWDPTNFYYAPNWGIAGANPPPANRVPGPGDDIEFSSYMFGTVKAAEGAHVASITVDKNGGGTILAGKQIFLNGALTVTSGSPIIQSEQAALTNLPTLLAMGGVTVNDDLMVGESGFLGTAPPPAGARFTEVRSRIKPIVVGNSNPGSGALIIAANADIDFLTTYIGQTQGSSGRVDVIAATTATPSASRTPFSGPANNGMVVGWQGTGVLWIDSGTSNGSTAARNPTVGILAIGGGTDLLSGRLNGTAIKGGDGTV
jgi:hypothetical protein